jgi:hypothetical protein
MSLHNALNIAIPALGLVAVLVIPNDPRLTRGPPFVTREPQRRYLMAFFAFLLFLAVVHAITD